MFTLRTHVLICGALFAALIGIAMLGNVLQAAGMRAPAGAGRTVAVVCYFALFAAFGLSTIPVIVKLVLAGQIQVGTQDVAIVAVAIRRQNTIIWLLWGAMGAGLLIAIPAAAVGGMFGDGPQRALRGMFKPPNLGVLAAKPNMALNDMVAQSTIKLDLRYAHSAIAGGRDGVFDFKIPGTTLTFPGARYYFITTYSSDPKRIEAVNVGISPDKRASTAIDLADAALRARLASDGWLVGHEVYRTDEDPSFTAAVAKGTKDDIGSRTMSC
ncbi:MAG: hypothetical protein ABJF01_05270 [bacterium]